MRNIYSGKSKLERLANRLITSDPSGYFVKFALGNINIQDGYYTNKTAARAHAIARLRQYITNDSIIIELLTLREDTAP